MKLIDFHLKNPEVNLGMTDLRLLNVKRGDCFGGICTFCIDTDGTIYPCTFAIGKKDYEIGNIYNENPLDKDKLKKLLMRILEILKNVQVVQEKNTVLL